MPSRSLILTKGGPKAPHARKENPPWTKGLVQGAFTGWIPAITDFRANGTIMGPAGKLDCLI